MKKRPANTTGTRRGDSKAPPTNAWPKGKSGNPEGRPKTDPEMVEAFRARTPRALATLDKVMADFSTDADITAAAKSIARFATPNVRKPR